MVRDPFGNVSQIAHQQAAAPAEWMETEPLRDRRAELSAVGPARSQG